MLGNRISYQIRKLQTYDIILFIAEYKSSEPRNKSLCRDPFCTGGTQSVVIIKQRTVLLHAPALYVYIQFPIVNIIIHTEYGTFNQIFQ